jgi:hypothetical protein
VEIMPRLRSTPSSGAVVAVSGAIGLFRLDEAGAALDPDVAGHVSGNISIMEAL